MTLSQNAIIRTLTLGAAISGVRLLRTEIARQAKNDANALTAMFALWLNSELGRIEEALDRDIDRIINDA